MLKLNVGNKWNMFFLDEIIRLNKKYESNNIRVNELYGNPANGILSGVRPDARLPQIHKKEVVEFIKVAKQNNIEINFTLNRSCLGDITEIELGKMQDEIYLYEDIGVDRFTVYSPYLIETLNFKRIEISTIHNNTNVNYIMGTNDFSPVIDKICLPIYLNRDFKKLMKLAKLVPSPELIVNEFCVSYGNTCLHRMECYNIQSHNNNTPYPFDTCSLYRKEIPVAWLRAPFILPRWLDLYQKHTGINNFKLTGRTHSNESILKIIECYLNKLYIGPIHGLWGEGLPYNSLASDDEIQSDDIEKVNFINKFIEEKFHCENTLCEIECNYCRDKVREMRLNHE